MYVPAMVAHLVTASARWSSAALPLWPLAAAVTGRSLGATFRSVFIAAPLAGTAVAVATAGYRTALGLDSGAAAAAGSTAAAGSAAAATSEARRALFAGLAGASFGAIFGRHAVRSVAAWASFAVAVAAAPDAVAAVPGAVDDAGRSIKRWLSAA